MLIDFGAKIFDNITSYIFLTTTKLPYHVAILKPWTYIVTISRPPLSCLIRCRGKKRRKKKIQGLRITTITKLSLIHFWPTFTFYNPWKHEETPERQRLLVFPGGIKWEHWPEMNACNLIQNNFVDNRLVFSEAYIGPHQTSITKLFY